MGQGSYAQGQRLKIIEKIKKSIIEADRVGIPINERKLISVICLDTGSTERKAKEYVKIFINSEFVLRTPEGLKLKKEKKEII